MPTDNITKCQTFAAGQDLSTYQYCFMALAADGQIDPAGYGVETEGVLQNDPAVAGQAASVACLQGDITLCKAGGVVRVGREIMSDASGRGIEATAGGRVQGVAKSAAGAANEYFSLLLKRGGNTPDVTTTTTTTSSSTTTTTTA